MTTTASPVSKQTASAAQETGATGAAATKEGTPYEEHFTSYQISLEAAKEAMANIGAGLGTSISFAQSAGQQVAMDITRGLMQGGSQYLAKKFRTVKVHLKANYQVMLYAKQQ